VAAKKRYAFRCQVTRVLLGQVVSNEPGTQQDLFKPEPVFDLTVKQMPDLTELTALLTKKSAE